MRILKLYIENFLGFEKVDLDVPKGPAFIIGENRDQVTQGSNGSGKTALTQAITWCLFDVLRPGFLKDGVIRSGEEYALVRVTMEADGKQVVMERTRNHPDKGSGSTLLVDGESRTQHKDDGTMATLEKIIGVTKKAFLKCGISEDPTVNPPFVSLTPAPMLKIVTEILDLDRFDVYTKSASAIAKDFTKSNESALLSVHSIKERMTELKETEDSLEVAIETFNTQRDADLAVLEGKLAKVWEQREEISKEIDTYDAASSEFNAFDTTKVEESKELEAKIRKLKNDKLPAAKDKLATIQSKVRVEQSKVASINDKINNLAGDNPECGYCGSDLAGSKKTVLKEAEFLKELEQQTHRLTGLEADRLVQASEVKKIERECDGLITQLAEAYEVVKAYDALKEQMDSLDKLQNQLELVDEKVLGVRRSITEVEARSVQALESELLKTTQSIIDAHTNLKKSKKDVKDSDLSIKAIDLLNKCFKRIKYGVMNGFISKLVVQINHNLNQFTEGDFHATLDMGRDGLTLSFTNGDQLGYRSYATFSRGEQVRIMKATQIALAQVSGSKVLIEDEGFSNVNPAGVQMIIDFMLDSGMSNILFVSHATTVADYLREYPTIKVLKENGVSTVQLIE